MSINLITSYIIFGILTISMVSGLFISAGVSVLLGTLLINSFTTARTQINLDFLNIIQKNKLLILIIFFIALSLSSLIWSKNFQLTFTTLSKSLGLIFAFAIIYPNLDKFTKDDYIINSVFFGFIGAIILFYIEYFSHGIITKTFKTIFEPHKISHFNLYSLDRGCTLLSSTFWAFLGYCFARKKYFLSLILYFIIYSLLFLSDSLASLVGFSLASLSFIAARFINIKLLKLVTKAIILGSILMIPFAYFFPVEKLSDQYDFLPASAKHRLFIWNYVSHIIPDNPILGIGAGCSKIVDIPSSAYINFQNYTWSPLPLHPHNNVLQIFLELGIIGLTLYLLIIKKLLNRIEILVYSDQKDYWIAAYSGFINYYTICMISYSFWQSWWVAVNIWLLIIFKLIYTTTINKVNVN